MCDFTLRWCWPHSGNLCDGTDRETNTWMADAIYWLVCTYEVHMYILCTYTVQNRPVYDGTATVLVWNGGMEGYTSGALLKTVQ